MPEIPGSIYSGIISSIQNAWSGLSSIPSFVNSYTDNVKESLTSGIDTVGQGISAGLNFIGNALLGGITAIGSFFYQALSDFPKYLVENLNYLINILQPIIESIRDYIYYAITNIGNGFYTIGQWMYNTIANAITYLFNTIKPIFDMIYSWFNYAITNIQVLFNNAKSEINNYLSTLSGLIINKASRLMAYNLGMLMLKKSIEGPNKLNIFDTTVNVFTGMLLGDILGNVLTKV